LVEKIENACPVIGKGIRWMKSLIICLFVAFATPAYAFDVEDAMTQIANQHGVDPATVRAVAEVESSMRCGVKNGASQGIMQVQKGAAKHVGVRWPFKTCNDEIEAGVKYLKLAIDRGGDGCIGYTLYNEGINARLHCSAYGRKVIRIKSK